MRFKGVCAGLKVTGKVHGKLWNYIHQGPQKARTLLAFGGQDNTQFGKVCRTLGRTKTEQDFALCRSCSVSLSLGDGLISQEAKSQFPLFLRSQARFSQGRLQCRPLRVLDSVQGSVVAPIDLGKAR